MQLTQYFSGLVQFGCFNISINVCFILLISKWFARDCNLLDKYGANQCLKK